MIVLDDQLAALSQELWDWVKDGRPIGEAPEDIQEKAKQYKERYWELKNEELKLMGCDM